MDKGLFQKLCADERLSQARLRTARLVEHIVPLFLMHEANATVIYSSKLADQIPRSYAAHAFKQFQRSMHLFELVRLCALWDAPARNRESIPTIIALFNEQDLIERFIAQMHATIASEAQPAERLRHGGNRRKQAWWIRDRKDAADRECEAARKHLFFATGKAASIEGSALLKSLRRVRNTYIAHNLNLPDPDILARSNIEPLRYGDEGRLLDETVTVANALHQCLNRTGFDWDDARKIAQRNARALWDNCSFQVHVWHPENTMPAAEC